MNIKKPFSKRSLAKFVNMAREVCMPSVIVHAFVFFDGRKVLSRNWGDDINYFSSKDFGIKPLSVMTILPWPIVSSVLII